MLLRSKKKYLDDVYILQKIYIGKNVLHYVTLLQYF